MDEVVDAGATTRIGLVGDYNPDVPAHRAIPLALKLAANAVGAQVRFDWLPTPEAGRPNALVGFDGIWCVPASPYLDMDGALAAIRYARELRIPFLGTCGGFQHALIEYARNQLGMPDADHAETSPASERAIITPLSCSLVDIMDTISLTADSLAANAYGALEITERYQCRYGLRRDCYDLMFSGALKVSGRDSQGEIRAIELPEHPFFVATLFQPERAALQGEISPLVAAFVRACVDFSQRSEPAAVITGTFATPYYAVIFTSLRTADDAQGYGLSAQRMVELARQQPGFLGVDSARDAEGMGITVSYWRDETSILDWKNNAEHQVIREAGRRRWYRAFTTRVSRVERNYSFES